MSVATRASSSSWINKCDWNSAMCWPFLSLCREEKNKAGTWGAHLCRTHVQCSTMELSWTERPQRVFTQLHPLWNHWCLDIQNSHQTYYILLHLLSRKKSRKETTGEMLKSKWSFPYTLYTLGLDTCFEAGANGCTQTKLGTHCALLLYVSKDVKNKEKWP